MKKALLFLASLICLHQTAHSQGIVSGIAAGAIVKNVIDKASQEVQQMIATATRNGDYLLEKNLSRLNAVIGNLRFALSEDLDKRFDQINQVEKQSIYDLNALAADILKKSSGTFLDTKEFLVMDLDNLLNRIPFLKGKNYISSINGIGQKYKPSGYYTIVCKGTAFQLDRHDSIFINGKLLPMDNIVKTQKNVLTFNVPVNELNTKYQVNNVARVNLTINSYQEEESHWYNPFSWFSDDLELINKYTGKMMLLPKYPVNSYSLLLLTNEKTYSKEEYDSEIGHLLLQRTPIKDQWTFGRVETNVPAGSLLIKGSEVAWGDPGIGWVSINPPYMYDDANNKVSIMCGSQWNNADRNFWIRCKYRKLESTTLKTKVPLQQLDKDIIGGLTYGTYHTQLPRNYAFFVLELQLFNGERITFTPYDQPQTGIKAELKPNNGNTQSLVVRIDPNEL